MGIEVDLAEFGVTFDAWFSEQCLHDDELIDESLSVLKQRKMLYQRVHAHPDGARIWREIESLADAA